MYVGPWQEYKLSKVIQLYEAEKRRSRSERRPGSRGSSQSGKHSAATAPNRTCGRHDGGSQRSEMSESLRSAITDIDEWRRVRRSRRGGSGTPQRQHEKGKPAAKAAARPKPGKRPTGDDTTGRKAQIDKMVKLYTNQVPPGAAAAAGGEAPACPHCPTPDTMYCSGTGRLHAEGQPPRSPVSGMSQMTAPSAAAAAAAASTADAQLPLQAGAAGVVPVTQHHQQQPRAEERTFAQQRSQHLQSAGISGSLFRTPLPLRALAKEAAAEQQPLQHHHHHGQGGTAATHGNVLSPCGSEAPSPGAPKHQPSHTPHLDEDEALLRVSQTLKRMTAPPRVPSPAMRSASPAAVPRPLHSPLFSPPLSASAGGEADVAELVNWAANLSEWKPATPQVS